MTIPAMSAAIDARYSDPRLVEISLCAWCMGCVPPVGRSLDERDEAGSDRGRVTVLGAVAEGVGRDVLDEVAPDPALLDDLGGRVVVGALGAGPAGDVEGGEVRDRDVAGAAPAQRGEVGQHQLHDARV